MTTLLKRIVVTILTSEARLLLRRTKPTIVAITGSVGKTSTKDAIYAVLKDRRSVRKSEKSFNAEIGVPLTVLGLSNAWHNPFLWCKNLIDGLLSAIFVREYPEVLILEMGVDRPGDMQRFTKWIKPDIVVLTRLPDVPVHVEYFKNPEAVSAEKMALVHALKSDGVLIFNNDDEQIRRAVETVQQRTVGYSRYSQTDFAATQDVVRYDAAARPVGMSFTLSHEHRAVTVELDGCIGVQHTYAAAAATAVAHEFGITLDGSIAGLKSVLPTPGRMRLLPGNDEVTVIDDSYNASPVAMERALQTLKETQTRGRRVAVLGDMLELGRYSVDAHEAVGKIVADAADILVTVGVRARKIAETARGQGMSTDCIHSYDDVERAIREIRALLEPNDIVLVKGSQSIRLERLVAAIMAKPEAAQELLVRQDDAWKA